ncbi:MAG: class GN sortase [Pseudomonadota bacterium]
MIGSKWQITAVVMAGLGLVASGLYIPAKAQLAQWLIRSAWAEASESGARVTPWSWADMAPVGRLSAPDHGKEWIVLAGVSGEAMAFGPGHVTASAAPGQSGHTILGGHRDTHFAFLEDVRVGDRFEVEGFGGKTRAYRVDHVRAVDTSLEPLELTPERSRLTLVTCYPFDAVRPGGPWRFVVDASAEI